MTFPNKTLSDHNPRLIYDRVAGWGDWSPWAKLTNIDPYVQVASGFASLTSKPDSQGESLRYYGHLDLTTACTGVQAVLTALYARHKTGKGQDQQTSLMTANLALQAMHITEYDASGSQPPRTGHAVSYHVPHQAFVTKTRWSAVSAHTDMEWRSLCATREQPEWAEDMRFSSNAKRVERRDTLIPMLQTCFQQQPARC